MPISKRNRVCLRLAGMSGASLGIFGLYQATLGTSDAIPTIFETVYSHCIIIIVCLHYYCIGKFLHTACFSRKRTLPPRPRDGGSVYLDAQGFPEARQTEMVRGQPRLDIQNVWILVYGLGLVFFVTGYCMLGIHPVCLAFAGMAVGILSADELVCPRGTLSPVYLSLRVSALISAMVSLALVSADLVGQVVVEYITSLDLYSIFFGLCLPFVAQFIMIAVKDTRHYAIGTVIEVCEFGFPFTAFLGLFHLSVAYGQRFQISTDDSSSSLHPPFDYAALLLNQSFDYASWTQRSTAAQTIIRTDGPFLLFYSLTPFMAIPVVVCYIECALEGCAIDPMLSLCLALCVRHLTSGTGSSVSWLGIYGTACCGLAWVIRIASEHQFVLGDPPGMHVNTQLDQRVVWERENQRSRELEEMAQSGENDELDASGENDELNVSV